MAEPVRALNSERLAPPSASVVNVGQKTSSRIPMKMYHTILRGNLGPPFPDKELALFTCAIDSDLTWQALARIGIEQSETLEILCNSAGDDPPDIEALGLGWECTEFPPNQSALEAIYKERRRKGMVMPPISKTGRDIRKIRDSIDRSVTESRFCDDADEIKALEKIFLEEVIGGPKTKDIPGNDILLLDNRNNDWDDCVPEVALIRAVAKSPPKNVQIILLVRWRRQEVGDTSPVPRIIQIFPLPKPNRAAKKAWLVPDEHGTGGMSDDS